jgi:hypothetical protein
MNRTRVLAIAAVFALSAALSACAGGSPGSPSSTGQAALPQTPLASEAIAPDHLNRKKMGRPTFHITVPRKHQRAHALGMHPNFIPASSAKVKITLTSVNGKAPAAGIVVTKTTNLTNCASGCTVSGPFSPPGTDGFTVTILDAGNHALSTASLSISIKAAAANTGSVTLNGIPSTFTFSGLPATGTAGTPITQVAVVVNALDAAGDTITGTYANPITLGNSDNSGATTFTPATLSSSGAGADFAYSGLAITPATLSAAALGATTGSQVFTPSVTAPTSFCIGGGAPGSGDTTECGATPGPAVNLYSTTGTGSSAAFIVSQPGWNETMPTPPPYTQAFTEMDSCSALATIAPNVAYSGAAYTATALVTATAGTCNATFTGGAGLSVVVPITFTTSTVGVFGKHRGSAPHKKP